jgi:SDR family mycofactocin-dependent oxidoreductase
VRIVHRREEMLDGKVAFITGAARGQGRSHAVRLAELGADIIAVDICAQIDSVPYNLSSYEDLEETRRLVEKAGRRCLAEAADVRDIHALDAAADRGSRELGGIDIVLANAGIFHAGREESNLEDVARNWSDAVDVLLTGVFNTIHVVKQRMIDQGRGGSIVITSSIAGLIGALDGSGGVGGYSAAKHGVVGLMRGYAKLLGPHNIRVNSVHPMGVATEMVTNPAFVSYYEEHPTELMPITRPLAVKIIEPSDVTDAIVWLVSDAAKYVTGVTLPIDGGAILA